MKRRDFFSFLSEVVGPHPGLLFVLLFAVWVATHASLMVYPFTYATLRDYEFGLALTLFFYPMFAVPSVGYLWCAELVSNCLRFPFNSAVFVLLVVVVSRYSMVLSIPGGERCSPRMPIADA